MERSRGWQKFKSGMKRAYQRYDRMMEKQGFYVVLAICVLVIGLSAFYTFRLRSEEEEPVLTSGEAESAGSSQAQTLSEAKELVTGSETVLAVPTEAPFSLSQPVSGFLDRTFSDTEPQFFAQTNAWQVHAGIDLQAEYGTAVSACAGGKVERVWQDNELGLCVLIDHENGYETLYAGLSSASTPPGTITPTFRRATRSYRGRHWDIAAMGCWRRAMVCRICIWKCTRTAGLWIRWQRF